MSREANANNIAGAGAVMGAGIATGAVGGANAAGSIMGLVRRTVIAGDQGWDRDGIFICSKFAFNFRTRQMFDGSDMYSFDDVVGYSCNYWEITLNFRDRIEAVKYNVGQPDRAAMLAKLFDDIWNGISFEPESKDLLPSYVDRVHQIKIGTLFRYAVRGFFLGLFVGIPLSGLLGLEQGNPMFFGVIWTMVGIFGLSIAWKKFKPVIRPRWKVLVS